MLPTGATVEMELRSVKLRRYLLSGCVAACSISTVPPVGSIVGALYQMLYIQSEVLLRMGESVARNM